MVNIPQAGGGIIYRVKKRNQLEEPKDTEEIKYEKYLDDYMKYLQEMEQQEAKVSVQKQQPFSQEQALGVSSPTQVFHPRLGVSSPSPGSPPPQWHRRQAPRPPRPGTAS